MESGIPRPALGGAHPDTVGMRSFLRMDFLQRIMNASDYGKSHLLPRSHLFLVLVGRTGLGGVEAAIRWQGRVRVENRADASGRLSGFQKPM